MLAGKANAATKPTALGSLLQAATYGMAIPNVYGMTQSPLLAIWAANLRQGGSTKKFKQLKKGITSYIENIDFLIGTNPIVGVNQMWVNGSLYPLTFTSASFSSSSFTGEFTVTDPYFYAVIAVTFETTYSATFDDYGGQGSTTVSGTWEVPLWNELHSGPDPTSPNSYRNYPYIYRWQPSYGASIYIDPIPQGAIPSTGTVKVYYAQLMDATSYQPPITKLYLSFESELGSGSEYADADLADQQIIYPMYAGIGSSQIDLGSGGVIPQLQAEVQGKFGLYSTGDCDFADIIEDCVKSGIAQASLAAASNTAAYTQIEHGLSGYSFPGMIQKKIWTMFDLETSMTVPFDMNNTAKNVILVFIMGQYSETSPTLPTVSDSNGNTYTLAGSGTIPNGASASYGWSCYYATGIAAGANSVTYTGYAKDGMAILVSEIAGVDTFDTLTLATGSSVTATVTTTNTQGNSGAIFAFSWQQNTPAANAGINAKGVWPVIIDPQIWPYAEWGASSLFAQQQNVTIPGNYSLSWLPSYISPETTNFMLMIAFKASQPATNPMPVSDFMDLPSLNTVRLQCRANSLYGSLSMNQQQAGSDWLKTLYQAAVAAPVYMGFKLYSFPYSEVSAAGNGAIYNAPTASGPIASLSTETGDILEAKGSTPPVEVQTVSRVNNPNVIQLQCINRSSNYNEVVVSQPDAGSIAFYGVRKQDPVVNNAVQSAAVARQILAVMVRRLQYGGDVYTFSLSPKWMLLAPMDLILITDPLADIDSLPVRLTSLDEQDDGSFDCQAAPFVYGMNNPQTLSADSPQPYTPSTTATAGSINTPIFLEPTPRLCGVQNSNQLWIVTSSNNSNYGGCQAYVSSDGGSSYAVLGDPIVGSAVTGETTADWPAATDPDTTNNLSVNLSESDGELESYGTTARDSFQYPCYVAGGGSYSIPYELMTYNDASLTGTNEYELMATGTGNELRRGVYNAPAAGVGVDHPSGSRFAFLNPAGTGMLKVTMDTAWIGIEIYFKFVTFNNFGTATQDLSDATAYTYTPLGTSGAPNPGGLPAQGFQINGA